ncbi:MAG TPA: TetR/AcrR family transcriptional regulator [Dermatophilaceae bacterium]
MVDTRASLLHAASTLLAAEGPEALTVRRIAAEAGVSTMGVYSRFGGKEGVIDALLRDGFQALADAMAAEPDSDEPVGDLRHCCTAYRAFALANPTRYRIMFEGLVPGVELSPESAAVAARSFEVLVAKVRRCVDAGLLSGGDPHQIAASLWSVTHGLVSLELGGHKPAVLSGDDPYERTVGAMVRGFSP